MEDLNEVQDPMKNEELQPVVEQAANAAADNDPNAGVSPETIRSLTR